MTNKKTNFNMAKVKSKKEAQESMKLTRKERKEMREKLSSISKVSPEDLIEALKAEPNGQLSLNVMMDTLWPKFKVVFGVGMPNKSIGTPDKVYQQQLESYRKWTASMRSIAKYWYMAGMQHKQNIKDVLSIMDSSKDVNAPEGISEETEKK